MVYFLLLIFSVAIFRQSGYYYSSKWILFFVKVDIILRQSGYYSSSKWILFFVKVDIILLKLAWFKFIGVVLVSKAFHCDIVLLTKE
jgi:hypothetical protein